MIIQFQSKKLQSQYEDFRKAQKAYPKEVAKKYISRINIIKHSKSIDELVQLPGLRCHALKGNRNGQWAINLTGYYRLIFTLIGDQCEIVQIEEVSKHYED